MKTLVISASGRENGTINKSCKEISEKDSNTEYISLFNYYIKPCTGCLSCTQTKKCVIDDDFDVVYNKIMDSQHITIGTPVYCHSIPGILKTFIDRCCSKVVPYTIVEENEPMMKKLKKVKQYQKQFSENTPFKNKSFVTITSCSTPGKRNKDMRAANKVLKQFIEDEMKGKIIEDIRYTDTLFKFKSR